LPVSGGAADDEFVYQFRPRMIGAENAFRLGAQSLEWSIGGQRGSTAYPMILRVRLGFRPSNFGGKRYIAEIWSRNAPRIEIASASYRSVAAMEDLGAAYSPFIRELHRRVVVAGGECRFDAGFPAWRWWPMAAVGVVSMLVLAYVVIRALTNGEIGAGALVVGFMGLFAWQMLPLILRNRPQQYDPRHIPDEVLP
jgi:hypothetical protein